MTGHSARAVLWSVVVALVARLAYFAEHARSAFFGVAILDEAYYDGAARGLLGGDAAAVFADPFRPPLYPLFLAVFYRFGGPHLDVAAAIAAQHLLGIATAGMVAWLGWRLAASSGEPGSAQAPAAGLTAGLLFAAAGPPVFFEGERLIASLFTFLVSASFVLAARAIERPAIGRWAAVGMAVALATQARANALLLVLPLGVFALAAPPRGRRLRSVAAAGLGLLLVQASFAAIRAHHGNGFQLLPSAGGVNLYLGNQRGADGIVPRQDRPVTYGEAYRDSVAVFAEAEYAAAKARGEVTAEMTPSRLSRYWTRRTLDEIRADPLGRVRLLLRKAALLLANRELPNNKSYDFILAEESAALRWLPVRWFLLLALAPIGCWSAMRHGQRSLAAYMALGLAVLAGGIVLFFVNSRFRLPLWPGAAAFAGVGAVALLGAVRTRSWRRLGAATTAAFGIGVLSLAIARDIELPGAGRDYFFRSLAHYEKGDLAAARVDAEQAVRSMAADAAAWMQLGNVLRAEGDQEAALGAYLRAAELRPDEPRVQNNLGVVLEALDRPREAFLAYRRALDLEPTYPPPWLNLALLELRAGLVDRAAKHLAQADTLGLRSAQRSAAEIRVAQLRGNRDRLQSLLAGIAEGDRDAVGQVLNDLARPVDPATLDGAGTGTANPKNQ